MKRAGIMFASMIAFATLISSCTVMNKSMKEPNSRVDFTKNDFTISEQVSGMGQTTKVFDIDWYRVFHATNTASLSETHGNGEMVNYAKIPVIGSFIIDETVNYALYDMMNKNPGYDIVFYPQYETRIRRPFLGLGIIYKKTTVKATARLAKFK